MYPNTTYSYSNTICRPGTGSGPVDNGIYLAKLGYTNAGSMSRREMSTSKVCGRTTTAKIRWPGTEKHENTRGVNERASTEPTCASSGAPCSELYYGHITKTKICLT